MTGPHHDDLLRVLPYARRYARALTGSQTRGDALVAAGLRAVVADFPAATDQLLDPRLALYREVSRNCAAAIEISEGALSLLQRQLLLLTALEELSLDRAAIVVGLPIDQAAWQLERAREQLRSAAATDVLIIEDEPVIAMDLEELVLRCGHRLVGVAASEDEAIALAEAHPTGLILADINLGVGGDGSAAVARIVRHHHIPVIFVTAYPERLLTGEAVEPAFVITKPFDPLTLAIATYQAVTGGVVLDPC